LATDDPVSKKDGWRNIAITLIIPEKGEGKAHTCVIACFQQLSA
jgi:hypothetical protein